MFDFRKVRNSEFIVFPEPIKSYTRAGYCNANIVTIKFDIPNKGGIDFTTIGTVQTIQQRNATFKISTEQNNTNIFGIPKSVHVNNTNSDLFLFIAVNNGEQVIVVPPGKSLVSPIYTNNYNFDIGYFTPLDRMMQLTQSNNRQAIVSFFDKEIPLLPTDLFVQENSLMIRNQFNLSSIAPISTVNILLPVNFDIGSDIFISKVDLYIFTRGVGDIFFSWDLGLSLFGVLQVGDFYSYPTGTTVLNTYFSKDVNKYYASDNFSPIEKVFTVLRLTSSGDFITGVINVYGKWYNI